MENIKNNMNVALDVVEQTADIDKKKEQLQAAIDNKKLLEALQRQKKLHTPHVKEYHIGRNDPCPCGSGKKYKNCCLQSGKYENYKLMKTKK